MTDPGTDERLFRILTYLVTSAGNAGRETTTLASFRMLDAMARLVELADESPQLSADPFLQDARTQFLEHFGEVMWAEDAFRTWTSELEASFVAEARRRNLETREERAPAEPAGEPSAE